MQSIKKVVIAGIEGVAKVGQDDQAKPWMEMAANALFEQMKKRGWDVVMGQPVIDALRPGEAETGIDREGLRTTLTGLRSTGASFSMSARRWAIWRRSPASNTPCRAAYC